MEIKEYEIWIGNYHLGQGSTRPVKPELLARCKATSFKIACCIFEHQSAIQSLTQRMTNRDPNIENVDFGIWYYNPKDNSNSWLGKYYESEEEAWKSFNKG